MKNNTPTTFDKYNMADGLSQDEFSRMLVLMDMGFDGMDTGDLEELIGYYRDIIAAKERQIADLNEELYQVTTEKTKSHK